MDLLGLIHVVEIRKGLSHKLEPDNSLTQWFWTWFFLCRFKIIHKTKSNLDLVNHLDSGLQFPGVVRLTIRYCIECMAKSIRTPPSIVLFGEGRKSEASWNQSETNGPLVSKYFCPHWLLIYRGKYYYSCFIHKMLQYIAYGQKCVDTSFYCDICFGLELRGLNRTVDKRHSR